MKSVLVLALVLTAAATAAPQNSLTAVLAGEQARRTALLAGDATALAALLSDDLRYIHSNGKREDKRMVVEGIRSKQVAYERFDLGQLDARPITADVVVVSGTLDQRKLGGGRWTDLRLLFHAVWRNESGTWRLVSLQTVLPPAPPPSKKS